MKYPVGTRIKYVSNGYGDNLRNPLWGGFHGEVEGTITENDRRPDGHVYYVVWDNNHTNTYNHYDIEPLPEGTFSDDLFIL